jgi:hypothetical protein
MYHPGTNPGYSSYVSGFDHIEDEFGEVGDVHDLRIYHYRSEGGHMTYRTGGDDPTSWILDNCVMEVIGMMDPGFYGHLNIATPDDGVYATMLMHRTNPSRPYVDLGVLLGEMREMPRLLRIEGRGLRRAANINLAYQFGWAPLISDLFRMLSFADQTDSRIRELQSLRKGSLRRTLVLDRRVLSSTQSGVWNSEGVYVVHPLTKVTKITVKGHARWKPTTAMPSTEDDMRALARRAVLGLTLDFSTAWELIPWSWLIDWFSNTGDFIAAHRNIIGASCDTLAIMRHGFTTNTAEPVDTVIDGRPLKFTRYKSTYETKTRARVQPSLAADLPFLTMRQVGILASIGVTRRFSGRGQN